MTVKDVYDFIDSFAPFCTQFDYDNSGILLGDENETVTLAVVTLDITAAAVDFAKSKNANLIITHHPIIFNPLKSVLSDGLVYKLATSGINVISAHTNLDMANGGVNDCLCEILNLRNITPIIPCGNVFEARTGELDRPTDCEDFAEFLSKTLSVRVKYTGNKKIKKVAVCGGSGAELLYAAKQHNCDALVTSDIKHNYFIDADTYGIALFDCGHYETENTVIRPLAKLLSEHFNKDFLPFDSGVIKYH